MIAKRALITGIGGQDGSYLAEWLLAKGYEVHGWGRKTDVEAYWRIAHLKGHIRMHQQDLADPDGMKAVLESIKPDECYHLAGVSGQGWTEDIERQTLIQNVMGTHHLLASIQAVVPQCRVLLAGSSEVFGGGVVSPQNEDTPFVPRSVYGVSKVTITQLGQIYRRVHGLNVCTAILFNHESPRRGEGFVTRKISLGVARIKLGLASTLTLGDTSAQRDWGDARSYVVGMWRMLQIPQPEDLVISTGQLRSVKDFVEEAFSCVGLRAEDYVRQDPSLLRPLESQVLLQGDSRRAHDLLGWKPEGSFHKLVSDMVEADLKRESGTLGLPIP